MGTHEKRRQMSDYKTRMADEYRQLVDRSEKLRTMLTKQADGTLGFEPTCPIGLLRHQLDVMDEYANILRRRAEIEHVELGVRRRSDARDKIREALAEGGAE